MPRSILLLLALLPVAGDAASSDASTVIAWQPERISSAAFESHPAFDPWSGDFYFVRSAPDFTGWRIYMSRCEVAGWREPAAPPFVGDGVEADPWFTPDGRSLYFISTRTTDGINREDLDIWRVDRDSEGAWGEPVRLPAPVNSAGHEWFPRLAADGWLHFGSKRAGGRGNTDIWRAREEGGAWTVENLGSAINSADDEYEAEISGDGLHMLVMTNGGLFESSRDSQGWSEKRLLPAPINGQGGEVGALFLPNGNVLYSRESHTTLSGEFALWRRSEAHDRGRACPKL